MAELIGHRGACGHAPENTLASLRMARGLGVDCVEFDVRITSDGIPVLLHDDSLDRTTDAAGLLSDCRLEALTGVDAGTWFAATFRGEKLPTLEEAVHVLVEEELRANVEIKGSPGQEAATAAAAVQVLMRCWPEEMPLPLLSSFAPACLASARQVAPKLPRALLFEEVPANWPQQLRALGCEGLHCHHHAASSSLVGAIREAGFACRVYTVNEAERAAELASMGVDAIVTDFPDRLLAAMRACPQG